MKKAIIVGSAHPLRGGGLSTFNERLARAYKEAGWEVVIYTFSLQYPSFLFPGKTQYSDEPKPTDLEIRVAINSINPLNWIRVGYKIKRENPDIVIFRYWIPFMGPCLGTIARIIKKNNKSKNIAIADNIIPHEKRAGDALFTSYFIKSMDGIITMSKSVLSDLKKIDINKPHSFCWHPLYDNFGEAISKSEAKKLLGLDQNETYILFFGFIREYKGLDLLLKALKQKNLSDLSIKLIVAGEFYTDSKPFLEYIKENDLEERVVLRTDFIPNDCVASYFCASDLVVQPYKEATQSGVTQIAYHFNKPMVVTNVGGLPETVPNEKVGYVVFPDEQEIASAIVRFFEEKKELDFTTSILEEKKKYSWEIFVSCINKLADTIVKQ